MIEAPSKDNNNPDPTKQWATFVKYVCVKCTKKTEIQRTLTSVEPPTCCDMDMIRVETHRRLVAIDFRSTPSAPYLTR